MKTEFYTKQGEVVMKLAGHLLQVDSGDRLPSVSDYCALLGAGSGTVQSALRTLIDAGAIEIESHGHQGTFIVSTNLTLLWKFSKFSVLTGCMPLPYTKRFQGLATALYSQFENANIPLSMNYVRGGRWRVQRVLEGQTNFTVCSRLTANNAMEEFPELNIAIELGERSFVGDCCIMFADPKETEIRDGMRIGVDGVTYDHVVFNEALCRDKKVEYVPLNYPEIFSTIRKGYIDATMWNTDESEERYIGLNCIPAAINDETRDIQVDYGWGVVITRDSDPQYAAILREIIDVDKLRLIQQNVIDNKMLPSY